MIFTRIKHWFDSRHGEVEMEVKKTSAGSSSSDIDAQGAPFSPRVKQWMESAKTAADKGDYDTADKYYLKIIHNDVDNSLAIYRYAKLLYEKGRFEDAAGYFHKVLKAHHDSYRSFYYLAKIDTNLDNYASAADHYNMAIYYNPEYIAAYTGLGDLHIKSGKYRDAVGCYEKALTLCKDKTVRGTILNTIATIHYHDKKLGDAARCWKDAISNDENNFRYLQNLGIVLNDMGLFKEAEAYIRRAHKLDNGNTDVLLNLSRSLLYQSRMDEAEEYCNKALMLDPENELLSNQVARILVRRGKREEALSFFRSLLEKHPDFLSTRRNMAFLELRLGHLTDGWQSYEVRKVIKNWQGIPGIPPPASYDNDFSGHDVLIFPEQGLGDEIMFASCLPDLIRKAAHVTVCCDARLASLFRRSFPEITVIGFERNTRPSLDGVTADIQELMGSLPIYFRTTIDSFPDHQGYLVADARKRTYWLQRLSRLGTGPKVGIAWRSKLSTGNREANYIPLPELASILAVPGVHFVNLQYDECADELAEAQRSSGSEITDFTDLDQFNDLDGVAALMSALDLVITVGISVGELAGALGRPVWSLKLNSWTMLGTDFSPWYPATRIFSPQSVGDWSGVIEQVGTLLRDYVDSWQAEHRDKQGS